MEPIIELTKIDYSSVFVAVFTILAGIKAISSIIEWIINKVGIETKWMRQKRGTQFVNYDCSCTYRITK